MNASARCPRLSPRASRRSDCSLICVAPTWNVWSLRPASSSTPGRRRVAQIAGSPCSRPTPSPRPAPMPRSPARPAIGDSARFSQVLPTSRTRDRREDRPGDRVAPGAAVSGASTVMPQRLHLPQAGRPDLQRVGAERDAVQAPPGGAAALARRPPGPCRRRARSSDRRRSGRRSGRNPPASGRRPSTSSRASPSWSSVSTRRCGGRSATAGRRMRGSTSCPFDRRAAQRQRVDQLARRRIANAVHHAVAQDPFVIGRRVPGMGNRVALAVEPSRPRRRGRRSRWCRRTGSR